jgi:hypothetical protein
VIKGAAEFWHKVTVPEMLAVGRGFTITIAFPAWGCEQLVALPSLTLTRLYINVPTTLVGAAIVTLFPLVVVTTWFAPPLILYVKVYGAVADAPVNVTRGEAASLQTVVVPEMLAVGRGFTVNVAVPLWACVHAVELASCTPSRL